MLRHEEMLDKAKRCDDAARRADPIVADFYRDAARHWRQIALQSELLEREPIYRIKAMMLRVAEDCGKLAAMAARITSETKGS
jgi:hypothetical protein